MLIRKNNQMNINFTKNTLLLVLVIILGFSSCAYELEDDADAIEEKFIEAYINKYYPGLTPTESGIYILSHEKNNEKEIASYESCYVSVKYSTKALDGTYTFSSYDTVAKKIGRYNRALYYGSHIWPWKLDKKAIGIEEILGMMRNNEKISAIIPDNLLNKTSNGTTISTDGQPVIYEIEIDNIIPDIEEYQAQIMKEFSAKYLNGAEPMYEDFYLIKHKETKEEIENNKYIYIKYVGRLTNGFVFDSNIQDTAKKYGFYNKDNKYETMSVKYNEDSLLVAENNSLILGFSRAISKMTYGEHISTIFTYTEGYGEIGNFSTGGKVPSYSPLSFEIWAEEKEDEEN